jgi:hypothetical protein
MTMTCEQVTGLVNQFSLIKACDVVCRGIVRLATQFQYPDGSNIDVFVDTEQNLFQSVIVSDLGQTTAYLLDVHLKLWSTKKRVQIVQEICESLGVEQQGGQFQIKLPLDRQDELPFAIMRLAQACSRIADLTMSQRFRTTGIFREDLEEYIEGLELPYDADIPVDGQFGKEVKVDFQVRGPHQTSLVLTASAANTASTHQVFNEILRKWVDLMPLKDKAQFITVFDSSAASVREDDVERLGIFSTMVGFPAQQDELRLILAA